MQITKVNREKGYSIDLRLLLGYKIMNHNKTLIWLITNSRCMLNLNWLTVAAARLIQ